MGRKEKPSWKSLLVGRTGLGDRLLRQTGRGCSGTEAAAGFTEGGLEHKRGRAGTKAGLLAPAASACSHRPYLFCPLLGVGHKVCCRAGHVCTNPQIRKHTGPGEDEEGAGPVPWSPAGRHRCEEEEAGPSESIRGP